MGFDIEENVQHSQPYPLTIQSHIIIQISNKTTTVLFLFLSLGGEVVLAFLKTLKSHKVVEKSQSKATNVTDMLWPSFNHGAPSVTMETQFPLSRGPEEKEMGEEVRTESC